MLIVNIRNIFRPAIPGCFSATDDRWLTADGSSAALRPVDLRLLLAAQAFHPVRLAGEVLSLLAMRTNGVRRGDLLPFPAAQGRAEQAGPDDDAPVIGGRFAHDRYRHSPPNPTRLPEARREAHSRLRSDAPAGNSGAARHTRRRAGRHR